MRLDKFLKVSRIIKRRTVAKEVADNKNITINGRMAKSGTDVKAGDKIELIYFNKTINFEVLEVPSGNVSKERAPELVKITAVKDN